MKVKENSAVSMRIRVGVDELEVTGPRSYVEEKIAEFEARHKGGRVPGTKPKPALGSGVGGTQGETSDTASDVPIIRIVDLIKESAEYQTIEEKVLSREARLPRILMSLYFAKEAGFPYLTTKDIERITDHVHPKVLARNVATAIRENSKFFSGDRLRTKGAVVRYKLNQLGTTEFERILGGKED